MEQQGECDEAGKGGVKGDQLLDGSDSGKGKVMDEKAERKAGNGPSEKEEKDAGPRY